MIAAPNAFIPSLPAIAAKIVVIGCCTKALNKGAIVSTPWAITCANVIIIPPNAETIFCNPLPIKSIKLFPTLANSISVASNIVWAFVSSSVLSAATWTFASNWSWLTNTTFCSSSDSSDIFSKNSANPSISPEVYLLVNIAEFFSLNPNPCK